MPWGPFGARNVVLEYSSHAGKSATSSSPKVPFRASTRRTSFNVAVRTFSSSSDCRMPYGAITSGKLGRETEGSGCRRESTGPAMRLSRGGRASARAPASMSDRSMPMTLAPVFATGIATGPFRNPVRGSGDAVDLGREARPARRRTRTRYHAARRSARFPSRNTPRNRPSLRDPSRSQSTGS